MPVNSRSLLHSSPVSHLGKDKALFQKNISSLAMAILTIGFLLGLTHGVAAQSLGDLFCNAYNSTEPFGQIFSWVAYVSGAFFCVQGIHHLRLHSESPQNAKLSTALMLLAGSACLLALPGIVSAIVLSIYGSGAGAGGALQCELGLEPAGGTSLDLMMASFVGNIKSPLISLISLIAIVVGLYMIVHGLMKASKHGLDPRTHSIPSILSNIVFGTLLLTIGDNLSMMLDSVFGNTNPDTISQGSVLAWGFVSKLGGGSAQFATAIAAALTFFQLIGIIDFVRGWMVMKKVVEGGGNVTMAQGITHIVGGTLAINIASFLKVMDATFGTGLM